MWILPNYGEDLSVICHSNTFTIMAETRHHVCINCNLKQWILGNRNIHYLWRWKVTESVEICSFAKIHISFNMYQITMFGLQMHETWRHMLLKLDVESTLHFVEDILENFLSRFRNKTDECCSIQKNYHYWLYYYQCNLFRMHIN